MFAYQPRHGTADDIDRGSIPDTLSESTATTRTQNVSTNDEATTDEVDREYPVLGHRDAARSAPDPRGCRLRLRITGSQPFQRGSIWRSKPVLTGRGFETEFTFQISDQSRSCSFVRDVATASELYKSCSVHGADGFAFVLHNDPDGAEALGEGGNGLGYAGMRNAIVVAFDTWYNPDAGDTLQDHIVVRWSGPDTANGRVGPGEQSRLAPPRLFPIADGRIHRVRLVYHPFLKFDLLEFFDASPALIPTLQDQGEAQSIGTLAVYLDRSETPLLAIPMNLASAVPMPQSQAYIGFTAATGRSFQKHDIISWHFCEQVGCPRLGVSPEDIHTALDYHQRSNV